jgi:hypothetical protein
MLIGKNKASGIHQGLCVEVKQGLQLRDVFEKMVNQQYSNYINVEEYATTM